MTLAAEPLAPVHDPTQSDPLRSPARRRRARIVELVLLAGGVLLFVLLLQRLGMQPVLANLRLVGWGILLIIGQEILAYVANTYGWRAAFPRTRPPIAFHRLLAARIAGDAVNYLTPTATFGGEVARVRLLRDTATTLDLAASVAVAKVSQTVGQVAFLIVGLCFIVASTPLPPGTHVPLIAGTVALCVLTVAAVVAQRRGMFAPLARLAALGGNRPHAVALGDRLRRLDAEIARFHTADRRALLRSSAWFFAGWTLGVLEIYLMLWLLRVPTTLALAFSIETLSVGLDAMLFFVPAKLGTQEGGKVLIFAALGLDPATGLSLGVLRRIRELAWALIGLVLIGRRRWLS